MFLNRVLFLQYDDSRLRLLLEFGRLSALTPFIPALPRPKIKDVVRTWYGLVRHGRNWSNFEHAHKKRGDDGVELEPSKGMVRT